MSLRVESGIRLDKIGLLRCSSILFQPVSSLHSSQLRPSPLSKFNKKCKIPLQTGNRYPTHRPDSNKKGNLPLSSPEDLTCTMIKTNQSASLAIIDSNALLLTDRMLSNQLDHLLKSSVDTSLLSYNLPNTMLAWSDLSPSIRNYRHLLNNNISILLRHLINKLSNNRHP